MSTNPSLFARLRKFFFGNPVTHKSPIYLDWDQYNDTPIPVSSVLSLVPKSEYVIELILTPVFTGIASCSLDAFLTHWMMNYFSYLILFVPYSPSSYNIYDKLRTYRSFFISMTSCCFLLRGCLVINDVYNASRYGKIYTRDTNEVKI